MKKRGGPKDRKPVGGRSVIVSVRLDPRQRYIVELAARQQRRSLSSYIEWAIEESFSKVKFADGSDFAAAVQDLWDVYEPDRLVKLAEKYPHLLDYEQQILWKLILEYSPLWEHEDHVSQENAHLPFRGLLKLQALRHSWLHFKAVAAGKEPYESLPGYSTLKKKS